MYTFCTHHPFAIADLKLSIEQQQIKNGDCGKPQDDGLLIPYNAVYQVDVCGDPLTIVGASLGYFSGISSVVLVLLILIMYPPCCGERRLTYRVEQSDAFYSN